MLRCYISRVENGHTIPSIETLEKCARALEIPMYKLFYEGDKPPERQELRALAMLLARMNDGQRRLGFTTAQWMARHNQE